MMYFQHTDEAKKQQGIRFTTKHGFLVLTGFVAEALGLRKVLTAGLHIKQKVYQHTPVDKVLQALVGILGGCRFMKDLNQAGLDCCQLRGNRHCDRVMLRTAIQSTLGSGRPSRFGGNTARSRGYRLPEGHFGVICANVELGTGRNERSGARTQQGCVRRFCLQSVFTRCRLASLARSLTRGGVGYRQDLP